MTDTQDVSRVARGVPNGGEFRSIHRAAVLSDIDAWSNNGFTSVEAEAWTQFTPIASNAAAWRDSGFTANEAMEWTKGNSPFFPTSGQREPFTFYGASEAEAWREAGFTASSASTWIRSLQHCYHNTLSASIKWKHACFTPTEAQRWLEICISNLHDGSDRGVSVEEASSWREEGFTATETERWLNAEFRLEDAINWRAHDYKLEDVLEFLAKDGTRDPEAFDKEGVA
jgi:hypothetical protein